MSRAKSLRAGLHAGACLLAAAIAVHVPMRIVEARSREEFGARFFDHLFGGLASDLAVLIPPLFAAWAALYAVLLVSGRRSALADKGINLAHAALGVPLAALCLAGVAAAEFHLQRGIWPSAWDARTSLGDAGFWSSSARALLLPRYRAPTLVSLVVIALAHAWMATRLRSLRERLRPLPLLVGAFAVLLFGFGIARISFLRSAKGLFPTVHNRDAELASPLQYFVRTATEARMNNIWVNAGAWLRLASFRGEDLPAGAAMLGLPSPPPGRPAGDPVRSFARQLPDAEPNTRPVEQLALDFSRALFSGSEIAPSVLEIALESLRASDVNALDAAAPPGIAPFMSSLYAGTHGLPLRARGARRMFHGGIRTSQAIAGFICGAGHLPFTWSAARDFGILPARCLTDVLSDAGFDNRFFLAAGLSFDAMDVFFRSHAIRPFGEESVPAGSAHGAWGFTDRALLRWVLGQIDGQVASGPRWDFVLTITNHGPYTAPPDLPAAVISRVDEALAGRRPAIGAEEHSRLLTLSYTDFALEEFLRAYFAGGDRSATIVLVHADHATSDSSPWAKRRVDPARKFLPETARIPFAILVPEALLARAADPASARAAFDRLGTWLEQGAISANDIPVLTLGLLSSSAPLRDLPRTSRWHTIGGQATSPWFIPPGDRGGSVWGVDAWSRTFVLDGQGNALGLREIVEPVSSPEAIATSPSAIRPAAAVVKRLLEGSAGPAGNR